LRPQARQNRLDGIDDFDDVGAGLALDAQDNGLLAVEPTADTGVFDAVDGFADVWITPARLR
jgi:hypothetical protein